MLLEEQNTEKSSAFSSSNKTVPAAASSAPQQPTISAIPNVSSNVLTALRNNPDNDEIKSFIRMLPNYDSVFPDALLVHIMHRSGIPNPSPAAARCLGIAAQKFVSDIINDALVLTELREEAKGGITNRETFVLTQDLVKEALSHRGIFVDAFH